MFLKFGGFPFGPIHIWGKVSEFKKRSIFRKNKNPEISRHRPPQSRTQPAQFQGSPDFSRENPMGRFICRFGVINVWDPPPFFSDVAIGWFHSIAGPEIRFCRPQRRYMKRAEPESSKIKHCQANGFFFSFKKLEIREEWEVRANWEVQMVRLRACCIRWVGSPFIVGGISGFPRKCRKSRCNP